MSMQSSMYNHQSNPGSYIYPQFIIDEKTGKVEVKLIDGNSGQILRHIPASELGEIIRSYYSISRNKSQRQARINGNGSIR